MRGSLLRMGRQGSKVLHEGPLKCIWAFGMGNGKSMVIIVLALAFVAALYWSFQVFKKNDFCVAIENMSS